MTGTPRIRSQVTIVIVSLALTGWSDASAPGMLRDLHDVHIGRLDPRMIGFRPEVIPPTGAALFGTDVIVGRALTWDRLTISTASRSRVQPKVK